MFRMWLLRVHRWISLLFAIPLAVVIITGLVLSFEPMAMGAKTASLNAERLAAILAKHDPNGQARAVTIRGYAGTVSIGGRGGQIHVDIVSNEKTTSPGTLADFFLASRLLHEHFIYDQRWVVTVSTIAMLVLIPLGLLMGWPRFRNTLAGWHKGTAWILLPLLIASPLTGLFLAYRITFSQPPASARAAAAPANLAEAARIVGAQYDLAQVNWIRPLGPRLAVRVSDGGEMRVFSVTKDGLVPAARNWPRLIHEGNWSGLVAPLINVAISAALVLLLTTGLWMWTRRRFRLL